MSAQPTADEEAARVQHMQQLFQSLGIEKMPPAEQKMWIKERMMTKELGLSLIGVVHKKEDRTMLWKFATSEHAADKEDIDVLAHFYEMHSNLDCCQLSIADVECLQIRKAFCASQIGLSDFIRWFADANGVDSWFETLKSSVHRHRRRMTEVVRGQTWVGDMCVYALTVPSAYFLNDIRLLLLHD
jgi:hypothetical protein